MPLRISERWRTVPSLPFVQASSLGRVRHSEGRNKLNRGIPRYGWWDGIRYITVFRFKTYRVARLVCEAFHGPPLPDRPSCLHKDENPRNNKPDNLMWGTQYDNLNMPKYLAYCHTRTGLNNDHVKGKMRKEGTMPRCDQCNKFVSLDSEQEPEVDITVDGDGNVSGEVRIVNTCQECGQEMSEMRFSLEVNAPDVVTEHLKKKGDHDLSVELEASRTDRYETKTRTGKKITNPRYQKHLYGAEGVVEWTCSCDKDWSAKVDWSDEVQASAMESLV